MQIWATFVLFEWQIATGAESLIKTLFPFSEGPHCSLLAFTLADLAPLC